MKLTTIQRMLLGRIYEKSNGDTQEMIPISSIKNDVQHITQVDKEIVEEAVEFLQRHRFIELIGIPNLFLITSRTLPFMRNKE